MVGDKPNLQGPHVYLAREGVDGTGGEGVRKREKQGGREVGRGTEAACASFDRVDLRILELMGCGLPDSAIGKRLQLGHRTIQRRVGRMMMRTGAFSRFSFGLRISELGLLPVDSHDRTDRG